MRTLEYAIFLNVIFLYAVHCGNRTTSSEELISAVEKALKNTSALSTSRHVSKLLRLVKKQREELIWKDKRIYASVCSGEFRNHVHSMERKFMSMFYVEKDAKYEDLLFKFIDSEWRLELQGNKTLYQNLSGDQLRRAYSKFVSQLKNHFSTHRPLKWRLFIRWLMETRGAAVGEDGKLEAFYEVFKEANDLGMSYSSFIESVLSHWNHAYRAPDIPAQVDVEKLYEKFMQITVKAETAKSCASLLRTIFKLKNSDFISKEKEEIDSTAKKDEQTISDEKQSTSVHVVA